MVRLKSPASSTEITASKSNPMCGFAASSMSRTPFERIASRYRSCRPSASSTSGKGCSRSMHETSQRTSSCVWSMPARRRTCATARWHHPRPTVGDRASNVVRQRAHLRNRQRRVQGADEVADARDQRRRIAGGSYD